MLPLSKHYSNEGYNYNGNISGYCMEVGQLTDFTCLPIPLSDCPSVCLSICLAVCVCLAVCLSVYLSVCLSGCLLVYYFYLSMLTLAYYLID